jgi:hypothetical protein
MLEKRSENMSSLTPIGVPPIGIAGLIILLITKFNLMVRNEDAGIFFVLHSNG